MNDNNVLEMNAVKGNRTLIEMIIIMNHDFGCIIRLS